MSTNLETMAETPLHTIHAIDVFTFFILVTFLRFNVFLFSKRFFIFKKLAKFRAARSTFKNNSNEIDL